MLKDTSFATSMENWGGDFPFFPSFSTSALMYQNEILNLDEIYLILYHISTDLKYLSPRNGES